MKIQKHEPHICQVCQKNKNPNELVSASLVRSSIAEIILKDHPEWKTSEGFICLADLTYYRSKYVEESLAAERGELSALDQEVVESLRSQEVLSRNINQEFESRITFGERISDKMAEFGGSWSFIFMFSGVLLIWILINSVAMLWKPFDPFPFIFLNLILSCLAAIQAPIIMMSQNRHDAKDRLRSESDYQVNLKAELEIRHMNAKLDQLLTHQWERLLEIQQMQFDQMQEMIANCTMKSGKKPQSNVDGSIE
jgi:uncharacterized membrane protein